MHLDKAPDAFRTISEVADDLDIPQHVLRFWETRFAQIKPMKRSGGRRYYRPDDVDLLRGIRRLLYGEGYTIRGVQRILKEQGIKSVQGLANGLARPAAPDPRDVESPSGGFDEANLPSPELDADTDDEAEDHRTAPVVVRREPALGALGAARREPTLRSAVGSTLGSPLGSPLGASLGPARREPDLGPDLGPPHGPAMLRHAEDGRPSAHSVSAANRRELDLERLETALQDLVACKQMLDSAFEDGSPSAAL
ncbi:MerR family transcriptional regulator [Rhodopseudomonas palustris]|uniref:Transcriptional regulator, MerR family n=1 Tax=Rhodopseudomonas palustris (strain BisB18) TaxID=316056 RepID=Q214F9_RHOPB